MLRDGDPCLSRAPFQLAKSPTPMWLAVCSPAFGGNNCLSFLEYCLGDLEMIISYPDIFSILPSEDSAFLRHQR